MPDRVATSTVSNEYKEAPHCEGIPGRATSAASARTCSAITFCHTHFSSGLVIINKGTHRKVNHQPVASEAQHTDWLFRGPGMRLDMTYHSSPGMLWSARAWNLPTGIVLKDSQCSGKADDHSANGSYSPMMCRCHWHTQTFQLHRSGLGEL